MTDDRIALLGCALAFVLAGGFVGVSYPVGRVLRRRNRPGQHRRSVPFQVAGANASETAESERRAA